MPVCTTALYDRAHIAMDRACRGVLAEVQGVPHAHELQACCCVQVAQQAVISLVWDWGLAVAAGSSAPQHCFLQGMLLCQGLSGYIEFAASNCRPVVDQTFGLGWTQHWKMKRCRVCSTLGHCCDMSGSSTTTEKGLTTQTPGVCCSSGAALHCWL